MINASEAKRRRRRRLRKRKRANTQVILDPATTLLKLKYQFFENLSRSKKTFILDVESIFEVNRPGPALTLMQRLYLANHCTYLYETFRKVRCNS